MSRAKQATLGGLARQIVDHGLDLEGLCHRPASEAQAELTALKGIGPWTAEVFLLFCAGHRDIFPAGDVALQHALGQWLGLETRPNEKKVRELVLQWSPHRGIAARLFWAWYAILKQGRSALP